MSSRSGGARTDALRPSHACGALAVLLTLISLSRSGVSAQSGQDFDPANAEWNGLSRFVEIAREDGVALEIVTRLDVGSLRPEDALVVLSPRQDLPAAALTDFMRAGGRVALADDFGHGESLLRTFRIGRGRPNRADALRLRGNEELLVARPVAGHPLTENVSALVTNHPQVVYHQDLEPIFAFGSGEAAQRDAVVLAGAVGQGRLVAIADPSVLINNMLELGGNRRFAGNLATYLLGQSGERSGGTLYLVPPGAVLAGRFGEPGADRPLHDVRAAIEAISRAEIPAGALRIAGAALAGILLVLAAGVLPRSSPYVGASMFARPSVSGGFAGRVSWFAQRPANLGDPAMVYKHELESELRDRLGLPARFGVEELAARMKARGMRSDDVAAARALHGELAQVHEEMERGTRGDALPEARFRRLVQQGDALLSRIEPLSRNEPLSRVERDRVDGART